ncbi:hypothetical protein D3C87_1232750 [compost metagenome]
MTDGAQWIANFMGDAGGQAPEGGEFQLLGLLRDVGEIFEKDQRLMLRAGVQCYEAGL